MLAVLPVQTLCERRGGEAAPAVRRVCDATMRGCAPAEKTAHQDALEFQDLQGLEPCKHEHILTQAVSVSCPALLHHFLVLRGFGFLFWLGP